MATLTYDSTPAENPEFNEQEQEALKIGEQAEADQQQLLAGKFRDPEALEQAYLELQSKLVNLVLSPKLSQLTKRHKRTCKVTRKMILLQSLKLRHCKTPLVERSGTMK